MKLGPCGHNRHSHGLVVVLVVVVVMWVLWRFPEPQRDR